MTERDIHDRDELWMESDGQSSVLDYNKVQLELDRMAAENERLRAALKPFARLCEIFPPDWKDMDPVTQVDADGDHDLTVGDLREAARVLEQELNETETKR